MRIWIRRTLAAVLVMSLMLSGSVVFATEPTEVLLTEAPAETAVATEAPVEESTLAPTEAPTEPEPEVVTYEVDTGAQLYKICAEMASGMSYDQLLVYDATNDKLVFEDTREGSKLYPASVTKLYSAWVALQILEPDDVITVGDELKLVHAGSSVADLRAGQRPYVRNLVEGMMLPSGNDAAIVLAVAAGRKLAGDETLEAEEAMYTFVDEMNRKGKELGFERSHFANPDGWHSGSHYTCIHDMIIIAKLALADATISRYIRRAEDDVTFASGHTLTWENTNKLLDEEEPYYRSDAVGMKTGYTRQAEQCLMSAYRCSDGRTLVIGVFGYADGNKRYSELNKLAKACKEQIKLEVKEAKAAAKKD